LEEREREKVRKREGLREIEKEIIHNKSNRIEENIKDT
jgi:hypothetical protein